MVDWSFIQEKKWQDLENSIRNHIERNFGAKEQEYVTDEFAIGDPVKIPETKDEKPSEQVSGKEKKAKSQQER